MQDSSNFKLSWKILLATVNKPLNNPAKTISKVSCTSSEESYA